MTASPAGEPRQLFSYRARRDGRTIVELRGLESPGGGVMVEAAVFASGPNGVPFHRPFAFSTREQAMRFLDEALTTLAYLSCTIE